jgi:hypothetical protein
VQRRRHEAPGSLEAGMDVFDRERSQRIR